jgi:hypothetical protein
MVLREDYLTNRWERVEKNLTFLKGLYEASPDESLLDCLGQVYKEYLEVMRLKWLMNDSQKLKEQTNQ